MIRPSEMSEQKRQALGEEPAKDDARAGASKSRSQAQQQQSPRPPSTERSEVQAINAEAAQPLSTPLSDPLNNANLNIFEQIFGAEAIASLRVTLDGLLDNKIDVQYRATTNQQSFQRVIDFAVDIFCRVGLRLRGNVEGEQYLTVREFL